MNQKPVNDNDKTFNTKDIPDSYKSSKYFPEFQQAVDAYNDLPWEKAKDEQIAQKMVYASAVFSSEFYQLMTAALEHAQDKNKSFGYNVPSFGGDDLYNTLLDVGKEELAGGLYEEDDIKQDANTAHVINMVNAAWQAEVDVSHIMKTAGYMPKEGVKPGTKLKEGDIDGVLPSNIINSNPAMTKYLMSVHDNSRIPDAAIGLIAVSEQYLHHMFQGILDNLPSDAKYDGVKEFFDRHVTIDGAEDGHAAKMQAILEKNIDNPDLLLRVATEMFVNKHTIYERTLEGKEIKPEDIKVAPLKLKDIELDKSCPNIGNCQSIGSSVG